MNEVESFMTLHRHDLVRIDASHWLELVSMQTENTRAFWLREWGAHNWPVIVRRDDCKSCPDNIAVGVPLPASCGKQRIALHVPLMAAVEKLSPVMLTECRGVAPKDWRAVLDHLEAVGDLAQVASGVCGSLLWQHLTGLPYLNGASDVDVLWRVTSLSQADAIARALPEVERHTGVRVDGEILSAHGWGIHWREFRTEAPEMLVKTRSGAQLCSKADVFEHLDGVA